MDRRINNRCRHYTRTQGVDIGHRGSAIRRQSVTEGCDRRVSRGESVGSRVPATGGVLAVTEPRDETGRGGGGVDPITVETIRNRVRVWTRRLLKIKKRVKKSTMAC